MGRDVNDKSTATPAAAKAKPKFVPDTRPLAGRDRQGEPPAWAIVVMIGVIGCVGLLYSMPFVAYAIFPFAHSDYFWIGLIFLPMAALIVLAAASKGLDLGRARSWSQTTGRIVSSSIAQRSHQFQREPETIENYAAVTYEFTTPGGRTVRGSRIGIGDDNRNADAEPTLARYPAGATVTVYYDPNDPKNCVLERGGPKGITAKTYVSALLELAAAGGIVWWLIARGPAFIAARFPQANEDVVVFAAGFGVLLCMMFYAHWRMAVQAQNWPSVRGKIVKSGVESYRERVGGANGTLTTFYRPAVEYTYQVHGNTFTGNQIKLGVAISGAQSYAEQVAAKYPVGRELDVHYDPANSTNAALENPGKFAWFLLVLALALFALAVGQLGIFK